MQKEYITLKNIGKDYGDGFVIKDLNTHIQQGAFTVILGPSGCGKSTLMNMIAGLEVVTTGEIFIDGVAVQDKPPKERGLAMVFQNYALYPHMSVADNIGYAMKIAGVKKNARMEKITEVAKIVELEHLLNRRPSQLSGGQQQRVAIARAIIRKPKGILYDEPLSNLDAKLRNEMRVELLRLHNEVHATSVFVTHDQIEAMTLADNIMVINNGAIEQYDIPDVIYNKPVSVFVAQFIGAPPMNVIPMQSIAKLLPNAHTIARTYGRAIHNILVGIRAEHISVYSHKDKAKPSMSATVQFIENMGAYGIARVRIKNIFLNISLLSSPLTAPIKTGDTVYIQFDTTHIHFFDKSTGKRL